MRKLALHLSTSPRAAPALPLDKLGSRAAEGRGMPTRGAPGATGPPPATSYAA
ncbi:MAG: hypothetical protein HXY37_14090 [Chloroflexi bacterium]|nr:hypothetical protein [Chloroflexota bacterium]